MSEPGNPEIIEPPPDAAGSQPPDPEAPDPGHDVGAREDQPLWWPNMEESRGILADYVSQFEKPFAEDGPLPEDPDPGEEN